MKGLRGAKGSDAQSMGSNHHYHPPLGSPGPPASASMGEVGGTAYKKYKLLGNTRYHSPRLHSGTQQSMTRKLPGNSDVLSGLRTAGPRGYLTTWHVIE